MICSCGRTPKLKTLVTPGGLAAKYQRLQCSCGLATDYCNADSPDLQKHLAIMWNNLKSSTLHPVNPFRNSGPRSVSSVLSVVKQSGSGSSSAILANTGVQNA